MPRNVAQRYAGWLDANRVGIVVLSVAIAALCAYLSSRLPIRSELSALLPRSERSVRDLRAISERARPFATVHVVIEADDPAARARASAGLRRRLAMIGPDLVAQFSPDEGASYRYAWRHRFLFADLADLEDARDALVQRIDQAKLDASPLYVSLDDDEPDQDRLTDLEDELAELEAKAAQPPPRASADGHVELLIVQAAFPSTDYVKARALLGAVRSAIGEVRGEVGGGVHFGLTGNSTMTVYEHDSVLVGMRLAAVLTVGLCALALLFYYRSGRLVVAMLWSLGVGVTATFAVTLATIGHLDMLSAFLAAIVVGNGINAGLILVARYLEEVRAGRAPLDAIGPALAGAARGTLAATATASVAYLSLVVTDFRGFRHFGAIAGLGMALTWLSTFTVLPALLCVYARRGWIKASAPPAFGAFLARLLPSRRLGVVVAVGAAITAGAVVITSRYVAGDPFTRDWRDLQSSTRDISRARQLTDKLRGVFDTGALQAAQAYQVAIAVDRRDQVAPLVAAIRADDAARPPERRWLTDVRSLDDLLPADQDAKLAVLADIRRLLDDPDLIATLSDDDRARLAKVRPPDDLRRLGDADVPVELAWPFIEKDGSIGRLMVLRGSNRFDSFNVADRLRFAAEVDRVPLPPGALAAGEALVVADIIRTMERDAPRMIGFALFGSVLAVFAVIGLRRHGLVTLASGLAGVTVMIAACALVGLKVHFLDLVALPITIGIGIDYAVNLAARDRQDGHLGPRHLLATTGGAVLLCSYTTTVGYGTLLLSANGGIRAFGLAALLGELSCITMALVVAPALLQVLRRRPAAAAVEPAPR